jgi:hypothetical protein
MVNNLHLYSGLLRGGEVGNPVEHTGHQVSRSATDFDADLGSLTINVSSHTKPKLTSTGTKSRRIPVPYYPLTWQQSRRSLTSGPRRPILPLLVTSAPRGHTFLPLRNVMIGLMWRPSEPPPLPPRDPGTLRRARPE